MSCSYYCSSTAISRCTYIKKISLITQKQKLLWSAIDIDKVLGGARSYLFIEYLNFKYFLICLEFLLKFHYKMKIYLLLIRNFVFYKILFTSFFLTFRPIWNYYLWFILLILSDVQHLNINKVYKNGIPYIIIVKRNVLLLSFYSSNCMKSNLKIILCNKKFKSYYIKLVLYLWRKKYLKVFKWIYVLVCISFLTRCMYNRGF